MKKIKFTDIKKDDIGKCFEIAERPRITSLSEIPSDLVQHMIKHYEKIVIAECANKLSHPKESLDWKNRNQAKNFPVFYRCSSGSLAFNNSNDNYTNANAGDAVQLLFLNQGKGPAIKSKKRISHF